MAELAGSLYRLTAERKVRSTVVYRSCFLGHFARGNHAAAPVLGESAWRTADGGRGAVAVALDQPLLVVAVLEREQREAQLLDRLERLHPEQLLLERADEALGAAVALRCGHERRSRADAEEAQLALEVVAEVLVAVVVAQAEPGGDARPVAAVVRPQPLAERLERLEARAGASRVDAAALLIHDQPEGGSIPAP